MRSIMDFWASFRLLPSAWLLLVQFILLILAMLTFHDVFYRTLTWAFRSACLTYYCQGHSSNPNVYFSGINFLSVERLYPQSLFY